MWQYNVDYLCHHGILGQKWGIRRFQNPDGSLTSAGKRRYRAESVDQISSAKGFEKRLNDLDIASAYLRRSERENRERFNTAENKLYKVAEKQKKIRKEEEAAGKEHTKDRYDKKADELASKMIESSMQSTYNEIWNKMGYDERKTLVQKAQDSGFVVSTKDITRVALNDKDRRQAMTAQFVGGIFLAALVNSSNIQKNSFEGQQFKVKDPNR